MNEAKEYASLEKYLERQDKRIAEQLEITVAAVNSDLRKLIHERMRQDERKQHPKEKERDKRKRQFKEDLDRKYNQKLETWLNREKDKEREYRKERERERDREKAKVKRLEREMELDPDEQARRISKFLTNERRKQREKEAIADAEKQLEWKPPEPAVMEEVEAPQEPAPDDVEIDEQVQRANRRIMYSVIEEQLPTRDGQGGSDEHPQQPVLELQAARSHAKVSNVSKPDGLFTAEQEPTDSKKKTYELNLPKVVTDNDQAKQHQDELQKSKLAQLFRQVPQTKQELWNYQIEWELLSKSAIIQRKIRPWLHKKSIEYMGVVEDNFVNIVEIRLMKSSSPESIVKRLREVLQDQAEDFVIKLWKMLIFELIRLKNGI